MVSYLSDIIVYWSENSHRDFLYITLLFRPEIRTFDLMQEGSYEFRGTVFVSHIQIPFYIGFECKVLKRCGGYLS